MTARKVADYFLSLVEKEAGDAMTNLKLQKLVYYAQGFWLALNGKPLFADPIQAWEHGPVVPALYRDFKVHGRSAIPSSANFNAADYPPDVRALLDEVNSVYGQYSAWKLRSLTHSEPPWVDAYTESPSTEIFHNSMQVYFAGLLNAPDQETQTK